MLNVLPRYFEAFLRLLYPGICAVCQALLGLEENGLCLSCLENVKKFRLSPSEEWIRISMQYGNEGWALFRYEGIVQELLHKIKFDRRRDLLCLFSEEITSFFRRRMDVNYDFAVSIPLDFKRQIERQFNQSDLITKMLPAHYRRRKFLTRRRSALPQSLLGKQDRKLNIGKVFVFSRRISLRKKSILLVDDIFTTGSTLEEAARVLKEAGASRVGYFVLARTPEKGS